MGPRGRCPTQQKRLSLANKESLVLSRTAQNVSIASVGVQYSQKKREQQRSDRTTQSDRSAGSASPLVDHHLRHRGTCRTSSTAADNRKVRVSQLQAVKHKRELCSGCWDAAQDFLTKPHTRPGRCSGSRFPVPRTCQGWGALKMALGMSPKRTGPQTQSSFTARGALKVANAK